MPIWLIIAIVCQIELSSRRLSEQRRKSNNWILIKLNTLYLYFILDNRKKNSYLLQLSFFAIYLLHRVVIQFQTIMWQQTNTKTSKKIQHYLSLLLQWTLETIVIPPLCFDLDDNTDAAIYFNILEEEDEKKQTKVEPTTTTTTTVFLKVLKERKKEKSEEGYSTIYGWWW